MLSNQYRQLVKILETNTKTLKNPHGQEVLLKLIPDCGETGRMDPRVREINRGCAAESALGAMKTWQGQRAEMGWVNYDVTGGAVLQEDRVLSGRDGRQIPLFVYTPKDGKKARPCIVYIHGGAFFGGFMKTVFNPSRCLAHNADCVVVAVDYALAPEHPFPQGLSDCFETIKYIYDHPDEFGVDKNRIGVSGDSAGGTLSSACCILDKRAGTNMIKFQGLIYPATDLGHVKNEFYDWSLDEYEIADADRDMALEAVMALGGDQDMMCDLYLDYRRELETNELVSPLYAADPACFPPTLIASAEFDYLRLEGEAFGRRLESAGVPVKLIRYCGMDHAFYDKLGTYPQTEDMMKEIAKEFRRVVG